MDDRIKSTETWKGLSTNPKFKKEFEECLKRYSYNIDLNDLLFRVSDDKLIITYNSKISDGRLIQYRLFEQTEFFIDDENNLVINRSSGRFESDKGYKFITTSGGVIKTHYSCNVYNEDGIELVFSRYDDRYSFDKIEYSSFMKDFQSVILGAYSPDLAVHAKIKGVYPYPKVRGEISQFTRQMRSIDELGIVEVTKCSFNKDIRVCDKEYYFNVLLNNQDLYTPELIHIISGEPFAILDNNSNMVIDPKYSKKITEKNYKEKANERFLEELQYGRDNIGYVDDILELYDLLIEKLEEKENVKKRTI